MVRPTFLDVNESDFLEEMLATAQEMVKNNTQVSIQQQAQLMLDLYQSRLLDWLFPYFVQVHLISTEPIPSMLERTVGTALT